MEIPTGIVFAVSRSATHTLSKANQAGIRLLAGLGVEGDAHQGRERMSDRLVSDPRELHDEPNSQTTPCSAPARPAVTAFARE